MNNVQLDHAAHRPAGHRPPLRLRRSDIMVLAEHFLRKFNAENGKSVAGFSPEAVERLTEHSWPGNVRELENVVERSVVMCETDLITVAQLSSSLTPQAQGVARIPGATFAEIERHAILSTLEAVGWSTTRAAKMLDISVRTIQYRLHDYNAAPRSSVAVVRKDEESAPQQQTAQAK